MAAASDNGSARLGDERASAGFAPAVQRTKTFPAALPLRRLDRVYFRGDVNLVRGFASHTDLARQASDHLPIIAEFKLDWRA